MLLKTMISPACGATWSITVVSFNSDMFKYTKYWFYDYRLYRKQNIKHWFDFTVLYNDERNSTYWPTLWTVHRTDLTIFYEELRIHLSIKPILYLQLILRTNFRHKIKGIENTVIELLLIQSIMWEWASS